MGGHSAVKKEMLESSGGKPTRKGRGCYDRTGLKSNLPKSIDGRKSPKPRTGKWEWDPIEERYIKGYDRISPQTGKPERYYPTTEEISAEYNIPLVTIRTRCTKFGWVEKKETWKAEIKRKADEVERQKLVDAELRIRTKSLKAAEKIIDRVAGNEDEGKVSVAESALPEDLSSLASALRRSQEVANVAIGIPKDGVKPAGPGEGSTKGVTVWARMRESRQEVVFGVQVSTEAV